MHCSSCGSYASFEDGFCTACGVEQRSSRLPVKREVAGVPVLWRRAAPVIARGAALVVAGVAAEWLMRSAARRAVAPESPKKRSRKNRAVAERPRDATAEIIAFSETIISRRVIVRR